MKILKEKARKIMFDSGFFTKYHYVLNVVYGNRDSQKLIHETSTIIWGCKVLKQNLDFLKRKYPRYADEFSDIYHPYYEELRRLHDKVLDLIYFNSTHGDEQEKTNDSD